MKIMKASGPSMEPCGTPIVTGVVVDNFPLTQISCFLFES